MIARNDRVELAARCAEKNRVSRKWSTHVDSIDRFAGLNRGKNLRRFFDSEQPAFRSMGIQSSYGDSGSLQPPALQFMIGKTNRLFKSIPRRDSNCLGQWNMSRDQNNSQILGDESHRISFGSR